jgi:hypothetical protein
MINNYLTTSGNGIVIMGADQQSMPHINESITPYPDGTGRLCYNGDIKYVNGSHHIFRNGVWQHLPYTSLSIGLTTEFENAIRWAEKKMKQEDRLLQMAKEYPVVLTALDNLKTAQEQVDIIAALVK